MGKVSLYLLGFVFVLVMLAACTAPSGTALADPVLPTLTDDTGWWVDTTSKLSPEVERELEKLSNEISKSGFQLGGAIFNNSISESLDLATKFGNQSKLGSAAKDNGIAIVVLLDKAGGSGEKPAIGVAIGSGLEGLLNDAKVGRFLDKTYVPARKEGNWEKGLVEFVSLIRQYIADPDAAEFADAPQEITWGQILLWIIVILLLLVASVILGPSSGSSGSGGYSGGGRSFGGGGGFSGGGAGR